MTEQLRVEVKLEPTDLLRRMEQFPNKLNHELGRAMKASLLHIQGSVPAYPDRPNPVREGILGKSLTVGDLGNIFEIKKRGIGIEGKFGTKLEYAPYVIDPERQAWMHKPYWWTMNTVKEKAEKGIQQLFEKAMQRMAAFLEGKGL